MQIKFYVTQSARTVIKLMGSTQCLKGSEVLKASSLALSGTTIRINRSYAL